MIVISPWARNLGDNKPNPKNYPWWPELISLLREPVTQVGVDGETQLVPDFRTNLDLPQLTSLLKTCRFWIGVDSFVQHWGWHMGVPGAVLWGPSRPEIYGHDTNLNIAPPRHLAAPNQFLTWTMVAPKLDWWIPPHQAAILMETWWPHSTLTRNS
jgi:hypothetical protein